MTDEQLAEKYWPEAIRMAFNYARRYGAFRFPVFDLEQAAIEGLMNALRYRRSDKIGGLVNVSVRHAVLDQYTNLARGERLRPTFSLNTMLASKDAMSVVGGRAGELDELAAPPETPPGPDPAEVVDRLLKKIRRTVDRALLIVLQDFDGNQTRAAAFLGVSKQTIYNHLKTIRQRFDPRWLDLQRERAS
jgi:DNA-binding NtrC family response regulator